MAHRGKERCHVGEDMSSDLKCNTLQSSVLRHILTIQKSEYKSFKCSNGSTVYLSRKILAHGSSYSHLC